MKNKHTFWYNKCDENKDDNNLLKYIQWGSADKLVTCNGIMDRSAEDRICYMRLLYEAPRDAKNIVADNLHLVGNADDPTLPMAVLLLHTSSGF